MQGRWNWLFSINKKCFWKASKVPARFLISAAVLAIVWLLIIQKNKIEHKTPDYQLKLAASESVQSAFHLIHDERLQMNVPMDLETDPQASGLIGAQSSILTSKKGNLKAKQTTINPNWAAVFIEMFREANLKAGDLVAAGMSGSFPALNIAFWIAAEKFGLRPIVISSLGSSGFGANIPGLSWLEMEGLLFRAGLIQSRSQAASIGAKGDLGLNLPQRGVKAAHRIIAKEKIPQLPGKRKSELIQARLDVFQSSQRDPIKAYINIGGGVASVGSAKIKKTFKPGVTTPDTSEYSVENPVTEKDLELGIMNYFKSENIPIINIVNIDRLARKYHLPVAPKVKPQLGQGPLYFLSLYSGPMVLIGLLTMLGVLIWQAKQIKNLLRAS